MSSIQHQYPVTVLVIGLNRMKMFAPGGEDVRSRWEWTEASVWTDRMLTALEQGVKGYAPIVGN